MLAFMPTPLPTDFQTPTSLSSNTMSLAVLPSSPMTYGQAPAPCLLPAAPSPSKRPKLTVNTSASLLPSTFGKSSTSLRLETLSATSPTVRNTFSNAYSAQRSQKPTLTPLATNLSPATVSGRRLPTPLRTELPDSVDSSELTTSSSVSTTSVSTLDSLPPDVPYRLAYNVPSILTNGPIPRTRNSRLSFAQSRPMFPAAKKVAFKAPLTEEIKTTKYTLKHSDLESSSSTISMLELSSSQEECDETSEQPRFSQNEDAEKHVDKTAPSPHTGDKRESDEEDSDSNPATPVAGRRKRHRQWTWTLSPVEPGSMVEQRAEEAGIGEEKMEGS